MAQRPKDSPADPLGIGQGGDPSENPLSGRVAVHPERVSAEAHVAQEIADLVRSRPGAVLGVATGGTMKGVYRELAVRARDVDLSRIRAFSLDEFLGLSPENPHSFRAFLESHFVGPLGLGAEQLVTPDASWAEADPAAAARAYEDHIAEAGGIDLQLLGIGRNGHVAFNEPGSLAASRTRVIRLDEVTRADAVGDFGSLDAVPTRAMTVGIATILDAKQIRLLAFGEGKAAAVGRVLRGPVGGDVPATLLNAHEGLQLHLDRGAAGLP